MKRAISLILGIIILFTLSICTSADNSVTLSYSESYNKSDNTVTVTVSIGNASGISSGCVSLFFNPDKNSFVSNGFNQVANSNVISEGGKTVDNDNECCCAFMSTAEISSSDCNGNGTLELCTFKFDVNGGYTAGAFYVKGSDFYKGDNEITVTAGGNESVLTANSTTTKKSGKEPKKDTAEVDAELNNVENNNDNIENNNVIGTDTIQSSEIVSYEDSTALTSTTNESNGNSTFIIISVVIAVLAVAVIAVIFTKKKFDNKSDNITKSEKSDK